jgi:hypothetical protein
MWAVLFIGLAIWLVPSFFWMAYGLFNEAAATTSEIVGEGYDAVTGNEPVSHGAEHIGEVIVGFEVNDASRGWGQWVESPHQLPEITGSVFASRMVDGEERSTLPAAGLRSQLRLNWTPLRPVADDEPDSRVCRNFVDQEGRRLRSTGCMEWTSLRVRIGERSTHLCVDLHEASEGHNILGTVQDVAHWVHWNDWHLSDGDVPVAANCVALRPSGYPYDAYRVALHRPGESIPMGWLSVRFVGARPADMIRTPVDIGFGTPTFPQPN